MADSQTATAMLLKDPDNPAGYLLTGRVGFSTITELNDVFSGVLVDQKTIEIDLLKLSFSNTAGVAMLIHWVNLAQEQSILLKLKNIPEQVQRLAQINGVEELLCQHDQQSPSL